jgi:hypothetical protein
MATKKSSKKPKKLNKAKKMEATKPLAVDMYVQFPGGPH